MSRRSLLVVGWVVLGTAFLLGWSADRNGIRSLRELEERAVLEEARLAEVQEAVRKTSVRLRLLREGESLVERSAREKGYVRQDEYLIELRSKASTPAASPDQE